MAKQNGTKSKAKPAAKSAAGKKISLWTKIVRWFKKLFKRKKKSDVRKIYKTTDGYFTQNDKIKKPRHVAVIDQRKDDGALAVTKIYSQEGKSGDLYLEKPVLTPKKHSALKENSIVGRHVQVATKGKDKKYKPIYSRDLEETGDKLTRKEHRQIKRNLGGTDKKRQESSKKLLKDWHNHFKGSKK